MEETKPQNVTNYREELLGRMKSRFPDRNFDVPDGSDSPDGSNSLEQSIIDALNEDKTKYDELDAKYKDYEKDATLLEQIFSRSPRSAAYLSEMARSGNPAVALRRAYGSRVLDALEDGNAAELIASIEEEDAKSRADNEAYEAEKEANLKKSFEALDAWGNAKGLDEDGKVKVFMRFYNILADALMGKYDTALFEMGWKADHYDEDIATARHEGEVTGRNEKIKETARRRQESAAMPPALAGQGVRADERSKKADIPDPWMLRQ